MNVATENFMAASQELVRHFLQQLIDQDPEAGELAAQMIEGREASIRLDLSVRAGLCPVLRVLRRATSAAVGDPVEIAVSGCTPERPGAEGLARRIWFFGRLSHWNSAH